MLRDPPTMSPSICGPPCAEDPLQMCQNSVTSNTLRESTLSFYSKSQSTSLTNTFFQPDNGQGQNKIPVKQYYIFTNASLLWKNSPSPSRSRPWPFVRTRSWPWPSPTSTTARPRPTSPPAVHFRVAQWWTSWTTSVQIDNFYRVCIWAVHKHKIMNH